MKIKCSLGELVFKNETNCTFEQIKIICNLAIDIKNDNSIDVNIKKTIDISFKVLLNNLIHQDVFDEIVVVILLSLLKKENKIKEMFEKYFFVTLT